jgi:hypothetical protein
VNHLERAAVARYPELQRLIDLRQCGGWSFQPVQVDGHLELLTGARVWPDGWSDAIAIRDRGDAKAFRCDPAGGEVWGREGSLAEVIDGLLELPEPGQPGAPTLVKARAQLWTPNDIAMQPWP